MRHTLRETWSGLRRNVALTVAVIVTVAVSLSLFGFGLLTMSEVNLAKGKWYDKVELTVYMCNKASRGGTCRSGEGATDANRKAVEQALDANPEVKEWFHVTKEEEFEEFKRVYASSPITASRTAEDMQDTYRIKLRDPENYEGVLTEIQALDEVNLVQAFREVLEPMFKTFSGLQWGTILMSVLLLVAASLQIGNMIRVAAFTRRREIGIMRLVGASNLYIVLPFLLESLLAGLIGVLLASGVLAAGYYFVIVQTAIPSITALPWIGWDAVGGAIVVIALVGVALAIIPTLFATRKYVQI